MRPRSLAARLPLAAIVLGYLTAQRLGRTYGSTPAERRRPMPGDNLVRRPQIVATHAATIDAPPEKVWPWLAQVGYHRGGWYTPRWVDVLFFPDNWPSANQLIDQFQDVEVGDFIPDGPTHTGCGFLVRHVEQNRSLVLQSTTHLPLTWRRRGRARVHWTWSFVLDPVTEGRGTRVAFRWRARTTPWWLTMGAELFVVPADLVMSRGMLRGLRKRAVQASVVGMPAQRTAKADGDASPVAPVSTLTGRRG